MIGFHLESKKENIDNKDDEKNNSKWPLIIIFIILVVALIFTGVGIYIGRKIFFGRRKRANELMDDGYDYIKDNSKEQAINDENKIGI